MEEIKKDDDEISLDLKKIPGFFKNLVKRKKKTESSEQTSETETPHETEKKQSEISFDAKKIWNFILKYKIIFLLLIIVFFSVYFRGSPINLPATDDWAQNTINTNLKNQIRTQINQQYPHLPDKQKSALVTEKFKEILIEQKDSIEQQKEQLSNQFKERFQDKDGQTYLLAIDPWLWYGYAKNFIDYGHFGNTFKNGQSWYSLRNGREGKKIGFNLFSFLIAVNYKIMNVFGDFSVMAATFYMPLILIALASLAAFFIARSFGGNIAGLTAGIIVGIHAALLTRTAAGFADTDNLITFFELFCLLFFVLAFYAKTKKKQWIFILLAGFFMGLYSISHESWWHIFDFLLGALGIVFLIYAWTKRTEIKKNFMNFLKLDETLRYIKLFFGFVFSFLFFGTLINMLIGSSFFNSIKSLITIPFTDPLAFTSAKKVAVSSIWPNVLTTVAEWNKISMNSIIGQIGGKLLFTLSIIGILFLFIKKVNGKRKYVFFGLLLTFWYISAIYASQTSARFIALLVPAFALALASFVAFTYSLISKLLSRGFHINKILSKLIVLLILFFIIFPPLLTGAENIAKNEIPGMNDAWYDSLIGIKEDSDDGIITSWWDFGHWFVAVAERRVTFDGGDQGERIHWVGKSLLTDNEAMSVGILRMLNCGQQKAPHVLEKYLNDDTVKAINILNKIMVVDKNQAEEILKQEGLNKKAIEDVLENTHCDDLLNQYYITSDDMVGKGGVWGHFGSWDFNKASMFNKVHNKEKQEGIEILQKDFNLSEDKAKDIYYQIKNTDADQWVSSWPGFSGTYDCTVKNNNANCGQGLIVNLTSYDAKLQTKEGIGIPKSIIYADEKGIHEKKFNNSNTGISIALVPVGKNFKAIFADSLQTKSIFTKLFYFKGHGLKCFDLLSYKTSVSNNQIFVWKVDWDCKTANILDEFKEKEETLIEPIPKKDPPKEEEIYEEKKLSEENKTEKELESDSESNTSS